MNTNPNQVGVYIPISEIFPDVKSDFETFKTLLQELSRTDTLFWCARINLIITNPLENEHISRQQIAIDQFLTKEEIVAVNQFALNQGGANRVTVFFRGQLLELMRWVLIYCQEHPNDGKTFEDSNIRRRFVQAALIASDFWAKRVYGDRFSLEGGINIARERSLGCIRKAIEGTSLCPELTRSFGRGWTIFIDYFRKHYALLESEFQSESGLSIEEYFKCLLIMTVHFVNPKSNNTGIFNPKTFADSIPMKDIFRKYIALESQGIDELRNALWNDTNEVTDQNATYDYLPIREKPILCAKDDRAIILDPIFYSEKASIGPLFMLTKNKSQNKANQIFSAFGKAFEHYSCDILDKMFLSIVENKHKRFSCNLKKEAQGKNEIEIDACINEIQKLVVFEIKAVWIREDRILDEDYQVYLKHLREKYGVTEQNSTTTHKIKGVGQLARILKVLSDKDFQKKNEEFNRVQSVYPILLVYDVFLTAPVYGNFLASEFEKLLVPDQKMESGELIKGNFRVHPLILMTIEDLENLELSVKHFNFTDLVSDYSKDCPDRLMSLKNYIAYSKYKNQIYYNKNLANKCLELFKETKAAIEVPPLGAMKISQV